MANAETAAKARISKLLKDIEAVGLTPPTTPDDISAVEREAVLKEWWKANRPAPDPKSNLQSLRSKADLLDVYYTNDTSEEALETAIKEAETFLKERSKQQMEERKEEKAANTEDLLSIAKEIGKAVGEEVGKAVSPKEKGEEREANYREYDPSDLAEAKTYFAPMVVWKVPKIRRGGQFINPPFGKIMFRHLEGGSVRVGNRTQTRYMCSYTTDSKKEQAYLETHPLFNKVFYLSEHQTRVASEDVEYAVKFGEMTNMLLTYQAPDIYRMAGAEEWRKEGIRIDMSMSLDTIRTELAGAMARKAVREKKQHIADLLRSDARSALLTTA